VRLNQLKQQLKAHLEGLEVAGVNVLPELLPALLLAFSCTLAAALVQKHLLLGAALDHQNVGDHFLHNAQPLVGLSRQPQATVRYLRADHRVRLQHRTLQDKEPTRMPNGRLELDQQAQSKQLQIGEPNRIFEYRLLQVVFGVAGYQVVEIASSQ